MTSTHKAILIGPEFISIGNAEIKDSEMYFKDISPFGRMKSILGEPVNLNDKWEERTLLKTSGKTDEKIRIYWFDRRGAGFTKGVNPVVMAEYETMKAKCIQLENGFERLWNLIKDESSDDRLKRRVKKEFDFYVEQLRQPYVRAQNPDGAQ